MSMESLPRFIRQALSEAEPLAQNTSDDNLGFGWIYYGLIRNVRPDFVVAIGSAKGFMPFCAARALQDNGTGHLVFIDPSYSGIEHPGWGGAGLWSNTVEVEARIAGFDLTGWMSHLKMTSEEAWPLVKEMTAGASVGLVVIDGAHTFENSLQDFEMYASLVSEGFVAFHDATSRWDNCEVWRTIDVLRARGYPVITLPQQVGLSIVEISKSWSFEKTWTYLCQESNRAERLLECARTILTRGDRVFEAYCGASPLTALLHDVEVFGFDCDADAIDALRMKHPQHRWERIEEKHLPFADLPDEIDVLMGLGLSHGYETWDAQHVVENVRYLLGRYFPRACFFEAAADYHDAEIIDDLGACLTRLRYECRTDLIGTDLSSFDRRRVLVAQR